MTEQITLELTVATVRQLDRRHGRRFFEFLNETRVRASRETVTALAEKADDPIRKIEPKLLAHVYGSLHMPQQGVLTRAAKKALDRT